MCVCVRVCVCVCVVSKAIQAINEAVDSGEASRTLATLRGPGTGLYGVTAECAPTYQADLSAIKEGKKTEGKNEGPGPGTDRGQPGDAPQGLTDDGSTEEET